jgi:hypothetical protein
MLKSAEVVEVILKDNDQNYPNYYTIRFKFLNRPGNNDENALKAYPLNAHIKSIPVPGEIVLIVSAASSFAGNFRLNDSIYYYMNDVNIQSSINYNGVPTAGNVPRSNNSSYQNASLGISSTPDQSQPTRTKKTFEIVNNVKPLQLFEGDIAIEGRYGNSIRLGYTIKTSNDITKQPTYTLGSVGDPILLISNTKTNSSLRGFRIEDIRTDDSSIYLTSTQRIPLTLAGPTTVTNVKMTTLGSPPFTQNLSGKQIIMNSDRIVLNAKEKELALSSKNGISITSTKDIVLESSNAITIDAPTINLGFPVLYSGVNGEILQSILTTILASFTPLPSPSTAASISSATALINSTLLSTKVYL